MDQSSREGSSHTDSQDKYPPFMEPEVSLPCSQDPDTGSCPEADEFCPYLPILFP
jgi:hypothetical protein